MPANQPNKPQTSPYEDDVVQLVNELNDISENLAAYFEFCQKRKQNLMGFLNETTHN